MSTIEEQLVRDVAAVTGDVVVTESDVMKAREELVVRLDTRRRRDRVRVLAVAAVAAVVIPLVAVTAFLTVRDKESAPPANPVPTNPTIDDSFLKGSAPTPDVLDGAWRVDNSTGMIRFASPNKFSEDDSGRLFANPANQGTYAIDGDLITFSIDGGAAGCAGQTFALRASVPKPGHLRLLYTQPAELPGCLPSVVRAQLEQVLPTSESLAGLSASSVADSEWDPPASRTALNGDWMAEGGDYLLEISPSDSYYVAGKSGELVDQGQWSLVGSTLTLASSAASRDCAAGDRLVLGRLEQAGGLPTVMRGTVERNTCGAAWTPPAWLLIPWPPQLMAGSAQDALEEPELLVVVDGQSVVGCTREMEINHEYG